MAAPVIQQNPSVPGILTEDDNGPLSQENGPGGAVHLSKESLIKSPMDYGQLKSYNSIGSDG